MSAEKTKHPVTLIHILTSFFASVLVIWGVSYYFTDSILYLQFDKTLAKYIHQPKSTYWHRREGFAATYHGLYGTDGIEDITQDPRQKIVIWGDSYVEGHQVNDDEKIAQVLTAGLAEQGLGNQLMSFGVGMSGNSVADYYFEIPKYEQLGINIAAHIILVTGLSDTLPDDEKDYERGVFEVNPYRLVWKEWHPANTSTKKVFKKFKLNFLWWTLRSASLSVPQMRFMIATAPPRASFHDNLRTVPPSDDELAAAWSFLFEKLRSQTSLPIVLMYSPRVPTIKDGAVTTQFDDEGKIALFTSVAQKYQIPVINTTNALYRILPGNRAVPAWFSQYQAKLRPF